MATLRSHVRIERSADEVWRVVSDADVTGPAIAGGIQGLKAHLERR